MISGLPEKLKEQRIKNNLSQKAVANRLDVSPAIISFYETGERTPSLEILVKLAGMYHCTSDYLLGLTNQYSDSSIDISRLGKEEAFAIKIIIEGLSY